MVFWGRYRIGVFSGPPFGPTLRRRSGRATSQFSDLLRTAAASNAPLAPRSLAFNMRTLTPTSAIGLEIGAEAFWNCFNSDFISMDCVIDPISAKLTASGGWTAWPSSPKDPSAMDIREDCRFHPRQDDAIQALEQLRLALKIAFATVMQKGGITPLAALNLAASAIGSLYVEVAAAHSGSDRCSCGWEPRGDADIEALISSLGLSAADGPPSLRPTMQVVRA